MDASRSVFINCPFDSEFEQLFDAIVFATACCGFIPRSALESGTVAEPRVNLARFNMPLELGMAMAHRFMSPEGEHDWLVLAPRGHAYVSFISDLAAFDPVSYDGSVDEIVAAVVAWLVTRGLPVPPVTPQMVLAKFPEFRTEKAELLRQWRGLPPWPHIVAVAVAKAGDLLAL